MHHFAGGGAPPAAVWLHQPAGIRILGDVIDRKPDGIYLLQRIMKMPNVHMLLGNHEHMMMDYVRRPQEFFLRQRWYNNGGRVTNNALQKLPESEKNDLLAYVEQLPLTIEVTVNGVDYLLVHGVPEGFVPDEHLWKYDNLIQAVVWERIDASTTLPKGKTVIFGHTPTIYYQPEKDPMSIWYGDHRIGLDCGAAFEDGRLSCLRLDDLQEYYSMCNENTEEENQ